MALNVLNQAIELHQNGNFAEAQKIYAQVLKAAPDNLDALYLSGILAQQQGHLDEALSFLNKAASIKPVFEIYKILGEVYFDKNDINKAIEAYKKAVAFEPEFVEGIYNLGALYQKQGNFDDAMACYTRTLEKIPDCVEAYINMAVIFSKKEQNIQAIDYYNKALCFNPENPIVYFNLGTLYRGINKYKQSIECFENALSFKPEDGEIYYSLGVCYLLDKQYVKAIGALNRALSLNYHPDDCYLNIGNAYFEANDEDKALEYFNKSVEFNPNNATAHNNIGIVYKFKNQLDKAIECYKKSLNIAPNDMQTKYNLARACITMGYFEEGWKYFAVRDQMYESYGKDTESLFNKEWKDNIEGKTIYVKQVGGHGDAVLFSRYLPLLHEKGANVVTKYNSAVLDLLKNNDLKATILDPSVSDDQIKYDARICGMCLPCYFKSDFETIPFQEGYVKADSDKIQAYREKYFDNNLFKVGIAWNTGTKSDKIHDDRTLSLEYFHKLAELSKIKVYSLQKGEGTEELLNWPSEIADLGATFNDFSDTAAAIANLDLVIGVDTSVTNLSGAMGKKTWIILPFIQDWRWFSGIDYSPWYKSVKLFRSEKVNDWNNIMVKIFNELKKIKD